MTVWQLHPEIEWADYLSDESRLRGEAVAIAFPANEDEAVSAMREAGKQGWPVTVQGGRTGIAGGAVPAGGAVLNLNRMNRILGMRRRQADGAFVIRVQAGLTLAGLRQALATKEIPAEGWKEEERQVLEEFRRASPHFLTTDPTEPSATIGGMIACNASGARSFRYGAIRRWVDAARILLADGTVIALARGRERAVGRQFRLMAGGRTIEGVLPSYALPSVKNAAGYYGAEGMDLLDLFIGSEGTLGVILEAEVILAPAPAVEWGLTAFLPNTPSVCRFVRAVREDRRGVAAIEYFSDSALELLRAAKAEGGVFGELPPIPEGKAAAVYVEIHAEDEAAAGETLERLIAAMNACGGKEETAWLATEPREMERAKAFRHAVPERVNALIAERKKRAPGLTKLGTDMAVPDGRLEAVMEMYERDLAARGYEAVLFGHIGDHHIHVNILPRSLEEYAEARCLYRQWAEQVCRWGGTISAEHGVGKLKKSLLPVMLGVEGVRQMQAVKGVLDPENRLAPGTLF